VDIGAVGEEGDDGAAIFAGFGEPAERGDEAVALGVPFDLEGIERGLLLAGSEDAGRERVA
jgi:hypothetical protein